MTNPKNSNYHWSIYITVAISVASALYWFGVDKFFIFSLLLICVAIVLAFNKRLVEKNASGINAIVAVFITIAGTYIGFSVTINRENAKQQAEAEILKSNTIQTQLNILRGIKGELQVSKQEIVNDYAMFVGIIGMKKDSSFNDEYDLGFKKYTRNISLPIVSQQLYTGDGLFSFLHPELAVKMLSCQKYCIKLINLLNTGQIENLRKYKQVAEMCEFLIETYSKIIDFQGELLINDKPPADIKNFIISINSSELKFVETMATKYPDEVTGMAIQITEIKSE